MVSGCPPPLGSLADASDGCTTHQELDLTVADRDLTAQHQLGMDPS
jgi:hypothetical protein